MQVLKAFSARGAKPENILSPLVKLPGKLCSDLLKGLPVPLSQVNLVNPGLPGHRTARAAEVSGPDAAPKTRHIDPVKPDVVKYGFPGLGLGFAGSIQGQVGPADEMPPLPGINPAVAHEKQQGAFIRECPGQIGRQLIRSGFVCGEQFQDVALSFPWHGGMPVLFA